MRITRRKALAIIPAAAVAPSLVPKKRSDEAAESPRGWCLVTVIDGKGREVFPPQRIPNAPHASASWKNQGSLVKVEKWRCYIDGWPDPFDFPLDYRAELPPGDTIHLQFYELGVFELTQV